MAAVEAAVEAVVGAAVVEAAVVAVAVAVAVAAVVAGVDALAFSFGRLARTHQGLGVLDELGGAHVRIIGYPF
jgi:hypothetical protein